MPHPVEIGVNDRVIDRFVVGLSIADCHHPRVGDHNVYISELLDPGRDRGFQSGEIAYISNQRHHSAACRRDHPRSLVQVVPGAQWIGNPNDISAYIDTDDVRAPFGEGDRMTAALATGSARDDRDMVVEFSHIGKIPEGSTALLGCRGGLGVAPDTRQMFCATRQTGMRTPGSTRSETIMRTRPGETLGEALTTVGLLLNVTAVPAFVAGLAMVSVTASGFAAVIMALAVVSFAISLVCLSVGGRRLDQSRRGLYRYYSG